MVMNLQRAIEIALEAHKGVLDKGGNPYILHPLRLMLQMDSEEEMIVAIRKYSKYIEMDEIIDVFHDCDLDGNGEMSISEMGSMEFSSNYEYIGGACSAPRQSPAAFRIPNFRNKQH